MGAIKQYILSDYYRYWGCRASILIIIFKALVNLNPAFTFQFWFRMAQGESGIIQWCSKQMHQHYCKKYNIYMPLEVEVGYGLYMGHCMCMVIAGGTKIGNNCNLSQFLNIGSNEGMCAVIGDNVYVGPHVCLVENVNIGDNATIGAGAVVTKDVPQNATAVGVPAQVLSYDQPAKYIRNSWKCNPS